MTKIAKIALIGREVDLVLEAMNEWKWGVEGHACERIIEKIEKATKKTEAARKSTAYKALQSKLPVGDGS